MGGTPLFESASWAIGRESPEEIDKPRRAAVKDREVQISPRALQVESYREGILEAGFRARDAQR